MTRDLLACDAAALGEGFSSGQFDPRDVVAACVRRIAECDDLVGACNHRADPEVMRERAADSASRWYNGTPLSALDGVPFGVKANIAVRDMPWHAGIAALKDRRADRDAACVARLRAAGMIPVAVFNMHEGALGVSSANPAFGTTSNPHDPTRIAGGSSGGSAAAVAAGMVPVALGTDSLGSVRLPSALCGVVGYKPARSEIPLEGVVPLAPRLDHVGVHARSVADIVAVMSLFNGDRPSAPSVRSLSRWRTAITVEAALGCACDRFLEGCDVRATVDWSDVDLRKVRRAGLVACERAAADGFREAMRDRPHGFSTEFRELVAWAESQPLARIRQTDAILNEVTARLRGDLAGTLLVGPTTHCAAPAHGAVIDPDLASLTAPAAIAGIPSLSIPLPTRSELPHGIQITGLHANDVLGAGQALFPGVAPIASI